MNFKHKNYSSQKTQKNSVRIRKSYYTFSKEYPIGTLGNKTKKEKKMHAKAMRIKIFICTVCFIIIALTGYFITNLGMKFSYKDVSNMLNTTGDQSINNQTGNFLTMNDVKAVYMPTEKLNDKKYIKNFIRSIKFKNANSVIIDFKTKDGKTAYLSNTTYAVMTNCAMFDNQTIKEAIASFNENNINVIAGIYCFEDPNAASFDHSAAVKYMNSNVVWLDKPSNNGGKPWLNPYSKKAQSYIKEIISEVNALGIKGFLLRSVCFPGGDNSKTAGFPGEVTKEDRNTALLTFIKSIRDQLTNDCFVLVLQTANDIINGNDKLYFGSLTDSAADGICADTAQRPEGYEPDKKTNYSSMLSLFSNMKNNMPNDSRLIVMINQEEFSNKYIRTISKNGYGSFILY